MHNKLTDSLEGNNIIYPLQFCFRKNSSTTHALIHLSNLIPESLDNGKFVYGIFVDCRRHSTRLIVKFYQVNLAIIYEVLLINGLKLIYLIENYK